MTAIHTPDAHPSAWACDSGAERVVRVVAYNTGGCQAVGLPEHDVVRHRTKATDCPHWHEWDTEAWGPTPGAVREQIRRAVAADDLFRWRDPEGTVRLTVTVPAALVELVAHFYREGWREAIGDVIAWEAARDPGPRNVVIAACNHALAGLDRGGGGG